MRFIDLSQPWAMEPRAARYYLGVYRSVVARKAAGEALDVAAVEAESGQKLGQAREFGIASGVATIPIDGPIVRKASYLESISGLASAEGVRAQVIRAVNDPEVSAIILDIDSPGGQIAGIADLAATINAAAALKPVVAYSDGIMASAAYWIAAAAGEVVIGRAAIAGSIGAILAWVDDSKALEMIGLEEVEFISSQSPLKNPDHATPEGKAEYQRLVDDAAGVFIRDVAKYRGVSTDTVTSDFGQGGVMVGKRAVKAGLADRVGTIDQLKQQLASGKYKPPTKSAASAATGGKSMGLKDRILAVIHGDEDAAVEGEAATPEPVTTVPTSQLEVFGVGGGGASIVSQSAAEVEAAMQARVDAAEAARADAEARAQQATEAAARQVEEARTAAADTFAASVAANALPAQQEEVAAAAKRLHLAGHGADLETCLTAKSTETIVAGVITGEQLKGATPASDNSNLAATDAAVAQTTAGYRGALPVEPVKVGG